MKRPYLSHFATVAEFRTAFNVWSDKVHELTKKVGDRVEEQYDLEDGSDLCYNLIEQGVIDPNQGVDEAARIVAMHLQQA